MPTIRQYPADEPAYAIGTAEAACLIFDDEDRAPSRRSSRRASAFSTPGCPRGPVAAAPRVARPAPGRGARGRRPAEEVDDADDALIFYTSGSTSRPKGVVLTHGAIARDCLLNAEAWRLRANDRSYVVLPLFHCNALFMQLIPALLSGATAVLGERYSASRYLDEAREHGITLANLTAGAIRSLLAQPAGAGDADTRSAS